MPLRAGIMKITVYPTIKTVATTMIVDPMTTRSSRQGVDRGDEGETGTDIDLDQHLEVA